APREINNSEQELYDRVELMEREIRRLQQVKLESDQALDEARELLGELEEERRSLRVRLEEAEQRLAGEVPSTPGDAEETERLHRRLELAMQEIRDLRASNEQLSEQARRGPTVAAPAAAAGNQFDWETQKRRLLEQLESNFDTAQPAEAKEKLRCEEVIRTTDRIVAEKDRQIEELRQQLAARPVEVPPAPVDTRAAVAEVLDADAVVRTERERLSQLQGEWEEKLRQAEVEVSIERAKIARERLQLEEKLRLLQSKAGGEGDGMSSDGKSATRGRWLTRLGLRGEKDGNG
ncbi:MAG: hypothetical protein AB7F89_26780, partial [Pirellulaceae bacterium]